MIDEKDLPKTKDGRIDFGRMSKEKMIEYQEGKKKINAKLKAYEVQARKEIEAEEQALVEKVKKEVEEEEQGSVKDSVNLDEMTKAELIDFAKANDIKIDPLSKKEVIKDAIEASLV